jgi:hypothetical protein
MTASRHSNVSSRDRIISKLLTMILARARHRAICEVKRELQAQGVKVNHVSITETSAQAMLLLRQHREWYDEAFEAVRQRWGGELEQDFGTLAQDLKRQAQDAS